LEEQAKRPIDKKLGEQAKRPIDKKLGEQAKRPINKKLGEQAKRPIDKKIAQLASLANRDRCSRRRSGLRGRALSNSDVRVAVTVQPSPRARVHTNAIPSKQAAEF
jgi:hypothetical protein